MKIEMYPARTHSTDERGLYNEILIELEKNLRNTWLLKPIRDLYRECLNKCSIDVKNGYQPYALSKHACGHRTVEIIMINRIEKKSLFIQYLRHLRKTKCQACSLNIVQEAEEKAKVDFFTIHHIYAHLRSFARKTFTSKSGMYFCSTCHFGAPHWKENREKIEADKEIEEIEKSEQVREKYKHYYSGSEF